MIADAFSRNPDDDKSAVAGLQYFYRRVIKFGQCILSNYFSWCSDGYVAACNIDDAVYR